MIKQNQVDTMRNIAAGEEVDGRSLAGAARRGLCTDPEATSIRLTTGGKQLLKAIDTLGWFQPKPSKTKAKAKAN